MEGGLARLLVEHTHLTAALRLPNARLFEQESVGVSALAGDAMLRYAAILLGLPWGSMF